MNNERTDELQRRAAVHGALADPARLRIVDTLTVGDASPSELSALLSMPSNLVAHHVKALETRGIVIRTRSEGDRRRTYLRLVPEALQSLAPETMARPRRVVFVCTANTARSQLAAALWRRASALPAASGGTRPAEHIAPGAVSASRRHHLSLPDVRPRSLQEVHVDGDLVVTVCDLAHEELGELADLHWSVPDPVQIGDAAAFDRAFDELDRRVGTLAPRLAAS